MKAWLRLLDPRSRSILLHGQVVVMAFLTVASSAFVQNAFPVVLSPPSHGAAAAAATRTLCASSLPDARMVVNKVDIDEETPRDFAAFEQWSTACGVQRHEGFQLILNDADGLDCSVMTTQDLPANQPVLIVPSNMILTGENARHELGGFAPVQQAEQKLLKKLDSPQQHLYPFYLWLKILKEFELGDESPWYPWLNSLPRYFSNGSSMTRYCTDCLPPLVGRLTLKEQIRYKQFVRALDNADSMAFLRDRTKRNEDLTKWAFAVVYTRSFPINWKSNGDVHIVPMVDMFNHGTQAEIELRSDDEGNCYAMTTYDVPAGSPLRISYGDPTNPSYLFARYGFLDQSSPATFCKIMIPHPTKEIIDIGYDHHKMLFYKDTGDVSQEVWDVLLYQLLGVENTWDQQSFYDAHMSGDYETKQSLHEQYFPKTLKALLDHVDTFLKELDKLTVKIEGSNPAIYPRLPILLEHNAFVRRTFLTVKARLMEYNV